MGVKIVSFPKLKIKVLFLRETVQLLDNLVELKIF